jgi:hypothetical protein
VGAAATEDVETASNMSNIKDTFSVFCSILAVYNPPITFVSTFTDPVRVFVPDRAGKHYHINKIILVIREYLYI